MKKYYPFIAAAITLITIGVGSYYFIIYMPGEDITTPEKAISVITGSLKITIPPGLASFGSDYLIAWARAIRSGRDSFILNGKSYSTNTGKSL